MVWKNNNSKEIQKMERKGVLDLSLFKKKGNSKTYTGYLLNKMKEARKEKNFEVASLIQHFYKKYLEFQKETDRSAIDIEIVDGWKSIDSIEIFKGFECDFIIKTHQKEKETGEVTSYPHTVRKENVNRLLYFIKKWEMGESHKCYDFAKIIGERDWKEVWKKRTEVYFPLYYFPLKILEALGIIKYSGRGTITRLK